MKGVSKEKKGIVAIVTVAFVTSIVTKISDLIFNFGEIGIAVDLIYLVLTIVFAVILAYWFSRRINALYQENAKKDRIIRQLQDKGANLRRWIEIHTSKFTVSLTEDVEKRLVFRIGDTINVQLDVYGGKADFYAMPIEIYEEFKGTSKWSREDRLEEFDVWILGKNVSSIKEDIRIVPTRRVLYFVTVKIPERPSESKCRLTVKRLDVIA